jgi:hypothetical protein
MPRNGEVWLFHMCIYKPPRRLPPSFLPSRPMLHFYLCLAPRLGLPIQQKARNNAGPPRDAAALPCDHVHMIQHSGSSEAAGSLRDAATLPHLTRASLQAVLQVATPLLQERIFAALSAHGHGAAATEASPLVGYRHVLALESTR